MRLLIRAPLPERYRSRQAWRGSIATAAQRAVTIGPMSPWFVHEGPLSVSALFYLPRAKRSKNSRHAQQPGLLDTLLPAVNDALKGIALRHGWQIDEVHGSKAYADGHEAGAVIEVMST